MLYLEADALKAVASYARRRCISLGEAASALILKGSSYQLGITRINGLPVFEVPDRFPKITPGEVRQLLDRE